MKEKAGRWVGLSVHRVMIADLMYFSRKVPTIPVQRHMRLGPVKAARAGWPSGPVGSRCSPKPLRLVAVDMPVLRRSYLGLPWAHLYEHPITVASVAVEKMDHGTQAVFFAKLRDPNRHRAGAMDRYLRWFIRSPQGQHGPGPAGAVDQPCCGGPCGGGCGGGPSIPTAIFARDNSAPSASASIPAWDVESLHPLSPLTFVLNYGVIDEEGNVNVRLIYDHRVMDGATVARAVGRSKRR